MQAEISVPDFLDAYPPPVRSNALVLRRLLLDNLPGVQEQVDIKARMIAYCFGSKYVDLICVIIPSKKGLKLGFNRGVELADQDGLLQGEGKISRFVEIKSEAQMESQSLKELIISALGLYKQKIAPGNDGSFV